MRSRYLRLGLPCPPIRSSGRATFTRTPNNNPTSSSPTKRRLSNGGLVRKKDTIVQQENTLFTWVNLCFIHFRTRIGVSLLLCREDLPHSCPRFPRSQISCKCSEVIFTPLPSKVALSPQKCTCYLWQCGKHKTIYVCVESLLPFALRSVQKLSLSHFSTYVLFHFMTAFNSSRNSLLLFASST